MNPRIYYPTNYIPAHDDGHLNLEAWTRLSLQKQKEFLAQAITKYHVTCAIGALYHIANNSGIGNEKAALESFIKDGVCLNNVDFAALDELTNVLRVTAVAESLLEPEKEPLARKIIFSVRSNYLCNPNCEPIRLAPDKFDVLSDAVSRGVNTITSGTGKIFSYLRSISPFDCSSGKKDNDINIESKPCRDVVINIPSKEEDSKEMSAGSSTYGSFGNFTHDKESREKNSYTPLLHPITPQVKLTQTRGTP